MELQLALDRLSIKKCHAILSETLDLLDIVEIGTSLILEHGAKIVEDFRKAYPKVRLLADTKIMDSGGYQSELFYKAGADMVTVLGQASNKTIWATREKAVFYERKIMVDLINIPSPLERVRQWEDWHIEYICLHQGSDDPLGNQTLFQRPGGLTNRSVSPYVFEHTKLAIAGALTPEKIEKMKYLPFEIAIVGGYVTERNKGWRKAVRSIKAVL